MYICKPNSKVNLSFLCFCSSFRILYNHHKEPALGTFAATSIHKQWCTFYSKNSRKEWTSGVDICLRWTLLSAKIVCPSTCTFIFVSLVVNSINRCLVNAE